MPLLAINCHLRRLPVKKLHISLKWLVAASILIATVTGSFFWKSNHQKSDYNVHVAQLKSEFMEKVNTSAKVEIIVLPDSTTVALFPASKLSYGQDFNTTHRTIYLSGEASFDVKRNIKKPFLVYANKVVTKVLGTQFVVRAYDNEMDVKVNVKSGQVSVYREAVDDTKEIVSKKSNKGLLLLPNQQAVFSRKSEEFNKTLVEKPEILIPIEEPTFVYDEVAISKVFRDIETAYGITIRYNQESLAGCQLSASLNRESFDQKLDIICKTVKASYQKFDGQIIINGGSCE
jgi:transmembrane sensor